MCPTCETRESKQYYENLKKIFQNFQAGYKGNIKLKLAARYRLDRLFEEKLTHEKLLTISNEKELLVDVHPLRNNSKTWEMLDTALAAGIHSCNHATGTNHLLGNRGVRKTQRKRMQADDEFVLFLRI